MFGRGSHRQKMGLTQRVLTSMPRLLTWLTLIFVVYLITNDPVGRPGGVGGSARRGGLGKGVNRHGGGGAGGGNLRGHGIHKGAAGATKGARINRGSVAATKGAGKAAVIGGAGSGFSGEGGEVDPDNESADASTDASLLGGGGGGGDDGEGSGLSLIGDVLDLGNGTGKICQFPFAVATRREKELFFALHPECEYLRACEVRPAPPPAPSTHVGHPARPTP